MGEANLTAGGNVGMVYSWGGTTGGGNMLRLQQNGEFQFGDVGMYSYSTLKPLNYVYDNEFHSILLQYGGTAASTKVYWDDRDIDTYISGVQLNRHQRGFA